MSDKSARTKIYRTIFGIGKELSMSKDDLKAVFFEIFAETSFSKSAFENLKKMQEHMLHLKAKSMKSRQEPGVTDIRSWRRTASQESKVAHQLSIINSGRAKIGLESMCNRMYKRPYKKLNGRQMQGLIEALKSIVERRA